VQTFASLQFGGTPGLQKLLVQVSTPLQALPSAQSAFVAHANVVVYCTVSFGLWLAVVYSEDRTSTSALESGRKSQPKFVEGAFVHD